MTNGEYVRRQAARLDTSDGVRVKFEGNAPAGGETKWLLMSEETFRSVLAAMTAEEV